MSDHDRCGCDESAALRRELEAGTPAMYRARLRDAERARDELAAEVERRVREHAALVETAQKALAETERERDEARADAASWLGQYEGAATDVSRLLRERDVARAALRDLVDALPLDDRPRTEAIRRARETLARWGMR